MRWPWWHTSITSLIGSVIDDPSYARLSDCRSAISPRPSINGALNPDRVVWWSGVEPVFVVAVYKQHQLLHLGPTALNSAKSCGLKKLWLLSCHVRDRRLFISVRRRSDHGDGMAMSLRSIQTMTLRAMTTMHRSSGRALESALHNGARLLRSLWTRRCPGRALSTRVSPELLSVSEEVRAAVHEGQPVVALESTIISHGMPYPRNIHSAIGTLNVMTRPCSCRRTLTALE